MNRGYNERKAVQAAAIFTKLEEGGVIDKYKLCKLMYYLERQTILKTGQPLFNDELFSAPLGPVASEVNHGIDIIVPPRKSRFIVFDDEYPFWKEHFSREGKSNICMTADPGDDELSEADIDLIQEISKMFENFDYPQLHDFFHSLPEHTNTRSNIPISFDKILRAEGFPEEEIRELQEEYQYYLDLIST